MGAFNSPHPFSISKDAVEFWMYFMKTIKDKEKANSFDPTKPFQMRLEQRLQCTVCNKTKYIHRPSENILSLPLATETANPPLKEVPDEKLEDRVKRESESKIKFEDCLAKFFAQEKVTIDCSNCGKKTEFSKVNKFSHFPEIFATSVARFDLDSGWVPRKISKT